MNDRIALKLIGVIPLNEYAKAIMHFSRMVEALSDEVAGKDAVDWDITRLEAGSALAEIRGQAETQESVDRVIAAYDVLGKAIQQKSPIPYSFAVIEEAHALTSVINGHIKSIEFRVGQNIHEVSEPLTKDLKPERLFSFGTVTGQIDTLSRRRYTFTLYDTLFGRAVTCYLRFEQEEIMRSAWGKIATVGGEIYRDPESGRPLEIRNVNFIEIQKEVPPEGYLLTKGIWPSFPNHILSEHLIREMRDDN